MRATPQATRRPSGRRWRRTALPRRVPSAIQGQWRAPREGPTSRHRSEASPPSLRRTHTTLHRRVRSRPRERMNDRSIRSGGCLDGPPTVSWPNVDASVRGSTGEPGMTPQSRGAIPLCPPAIERGRGVRSSQRPCDKTRRRPPSASQYAGPQWNSLPPRIGSGHRTYNGYVAGTQSDFGSTASTAALFVPACHDAVGRTPKVKIHFLLSLRADLREVGKAAFKVTTRVSLR